jgi:hypothetical protein
MNALKNEIARLSQAVADLRGGGPIQIISIYGGLLTDSGEIEADLLGAEITLMRAPDEDVEAFNARALTEAYLVGARHVVVRGLPSRRAVA